MPYYKTFDEALYASDNYKPHWLCPIDKNLCNTECYCYQEPDIFGEEPEDGKGGYFISDSSCRHVLHDREAMYLIEHCKTLVMSQLKKIQM